MKSFITSGPARTVFLWTPICASNCVGVLPIMVWELKLMIFWSFTGYRYALLQILFTVLLKSSFFQSLIRQLDFV